MAIRKSMELKEHEDIKIGVAKMAFRGKCIALNIHIRWYKVWEISAGEDENKRSYYFPTYTLKWKEWSTVSLDAYPLMRGWLGHKEEEELMYKCSAFVRKHHSLNVNVIEVTKRRLKVSSGFRIVCVIFYCSWTQT